MTRRAYGLLGVLLLCLFVFAKQASAAPDSWTISPTSSPFNGGWTSVTGGACGDLNVARTDNPYAALQCFQSAWQSYCSDPGSNSISVGAVPAYPDRLGFYATGFDGCAPIGGSGGGYSIYTTDADCDEASEWGGTPPSCPYVPTCPLVVGEVVIKQGSGTPPSTRCDNECSYSKGGGPNVLISGGYITAYTVDGACGGETDDGHVDGLNCIVTSSGTEYCADTQADTNCGTVNGEYVCLESVPPGNCLLTPGGQAICEADSQDETPDDTLSDGDTDYDIYNDGNTGGTSGGDGTTRGTGSGTGGTTVEGDGPGGEGVGDTEGECDDEACTGDLPTDNEEVDSFGDQLLEFYGRVAGSPLISAFGDIPGALPAGSCTAAESDPLAALGGAVLTLDVHCTMWPDLVTIIYPLMLALWSVLGGLIILRA